MESAKDDIKRFRNKLKKVKALSQKGEAGEREAAKNKLKQLRQKWGGLNENEAKYKNRSFKLHDFEDCKTIMIHCILDSNNKAEIEGHLRKKELYTFLTDEQYADAIAKFNHYYPLYLKQKQSLLIAFLLKNNIGLSGPENESEQSDCDTTGVLEAMEAIKAHPYGGRKLLK